MNIPKIRFKEFSKNWIYDSLNKLLSAVCAAWLNHCWHCCSGKHRSSRQMMIRCSILTVLINQHQPTAAVCQYLSISYAPLLAAARAWVYSPC